MSDLLLLCQTVASRLEFQHWRLAGKNLPPTVLTNFTLSAVTVKVGISTMARERES